MTYDEILDSVQNYNNYLIPEIPKFLAEYIDKHQNSYLTIQNDYFNIDKLLSYLANNYPKDNKIDEEIILRLILKYFGIEEQKND